MPLPRLLDAPRCWQHSPRWSTPTLTPRNRSPRPPPARWFPSSCPRHRLRLRLRSRGAAASVHRHGHGADSLPGLHHPHRSEFPAQGREGHLGYGLTFTRLTDPAIDLDKLPPIDFVVLSHMHEDHFDRFVQTHLDKNIPILTTKEAAAKLRQLGFTHTMGLSTWDAVEIEKGDARLRLTSVPGRHGNDGMQLLLPTVMDRSSISGPTPARPATACTSAAIP